MIQAVVYIIMMGILHRLVYYTEHRLVTYAFDAVKNSIIKKNNDDKKEPPKEEKK